MNSGEIKGGMPAIEYKILSLYAVLYIKYIIIILVLSLVDNNIRTHTESITANSQSISQVCGLTARDLVTAIRATTKRLFIALRRLALSICFQLRS